ncbi:cell division protein [Paenibacillus solisilvae]|uniref:Cell division protein n=1 Tax=Paenibacillus solisilvae TaxID=2486751 RepID=A0ABW0WAU1_9BACL
MVIVQTKIQINAPLELCFDMARDIDLHTKTVWKHTGEIAIAGRMSGRIEADEQVTFEATHFLVRQRLTSRIIEFNKPYVFVDQMVSGAFKSLNHRHEFTAIDNHTLMMDELKFEAPYGLLGKAAEALILKRYMRNFLLHRNLQLKTLAEEIHVRTQSNSKP